MIDFLLGFGFGVLLVGVLGWHIVDRLGVIDLLRADGGNCDLCGEAHPGKRQCPTWSSEWSL